MVALTHDNWKLMCAKAYDKPGCLWAEFEEDVSRLRSIKRLITKYHHTGELKERLILNHLVVWFNVFGTEGLKLLWFKMEEKDLSAIKPFLWHIGRLPPIIEGINTQDIPHDPVVVEALNKL